VSYAAFEKEVARVNDLLCVANLLSWDARVMMPPESISARANHLATVTELARETAVGEGMRRAIAAARAELATVPASDIRRRAVEEAAGAIATLDRIPAAIVSEVADLKMRANRLWGEARAKNDFASFAPALERMMELQRQTAEAIGYDGHPYDALLATYEPGVTWATLQRLFGELKTALLPLGQRALAARQPRSDFLSRAFPVEAQKEFSKRIAAKMGFDFSRGRLDDTLHPFEISFTRADVRLTSRFRETWMPGGMFATWHEAGHGMYEQNVAPALSRSAFTTDFVNLYAVGGASFGMHESQSRLWENRVGRSRRFWEIHFPELQADFPQQLGDVTAAEFWAAVNQCRPGLIRVEADELTYDLHVIMRCEIEAALMDGSLKVKDLPAIWAEKIRAYQGIEVPSDAQGVLQDVHWSMGMVGSFPTYTLGNIMGSQLFAVARDVPAVAVGLESGDYAPLAGWLAQNVHSFGRSSSPDETLRRVTGRSLDTAPYIADLTAKVDALAAL
jgi:carboxypeptidase Taq